MLINENDPRISELRARLDAFYAGTTAYDAFNTPPVYDGPWVIVRSEVERQLTKHPRCRVLEFGAGLSDFGNQVRDLRPRLELVAQDVTDRNRAYLLERFDTVHAGSLHNLQGPFHVIFSTYVWEHVSDPKATLDHLLNMLVPGGSLFIFCPRYDMPGYFPPSGRHLPIARRVLLGCRLAAKRAAVILGAKPAFIIHAEPAVLSQKWYRDADAIHWASYWDLKRALPPGYSMKRVGEGALGLKQRLLDRLLKVCAQITKPEILKDSSHV